MKDGDLPSRLVCWFFPVSVFCILNTKLNIPAEPSAVGRRNAENDAKTSQEAFLFLCVLGGLGG
jgi:hypothetical protein